MKDRRDVNFFDNGGGRFICKPGQYCYGWYELVFSPDRYEATRYPSPLAPAERQDFANEADARQWIADVVV